MYNEDEQRILLIYHKYSLKDVSEGGKVLKNLGGVTLECMLLVRDHDAHFCCYPCLICHCLGGKIFENKYLKVNIETTNCPMLL